MTRLPRPLRFMHQCMYISTVLVLVQSSAWTGSSNPDGKPQYKGSSAALGSVSLVLCPSGLAAPAKEHTGNENIGFFVQLWEAPSAIKGSARRRMIGRRVDG